jgi:CHASE2 domain-containing sensor protein
MQWIAWIVVWFLVGLVMTLDMWDKGNRVFAVGVAIVSTLLMVGGFMLLLGGV